MTIGQFCWNELSTPDVASAKTFYSTVFGWQFKEIQAGDMAYTIISVNDKDIAGMWQIPQDMQGKIPPHWIAYISVDSVKESLAKAKQHGAIELKEITEVPNMGLFAIVTDPTGAPFAMWETTGCK